MADGTRQMLLKEAETLMRTRGYAAFSYADLSERIGIRKASIHHHFPTKEDLGNALIDSYLAKFEDALANVLAKDRRAEIRLRRYTEFFAESLKDGMMPLCGALSAETFVLPESMQAQVRRFFGIHLEWLKTVLRDGVAAGELRADLDVKQTAALILSTLEGASLVAWALDSPAVIKPAIQQVVATISIKTKSAKE